jgi:MYXO-CTERM domain-containing protein
VGQVREDGVWIVEELADTFGVSRWDFERQARVSVGAVLRDSEIPVGPLSLWVLGDRPTAWVGTQEDNDGTLRLRSLDGEERVLETPVSGSFGLFPRARPRLLERGARVYAAEAGVLRALDGLNGVTEAVDTSWGVVFAAQDAPAGEWDDDVDPRQAVGGAPPGGTWSGRELWLLPKDGEPVQRLADLYPGPDGSEPAGFAVLPAEDGGEDLVLFHALTPDRGRELWRADATGEVRPVCELAPGAAPGVPVWADIRVGPDAVFVAAFVPGTGTEVVAIPKAAVAADTVDAAACRVVPPVGRLGEADSGCGCRTTGGTEASVAWVLVMAGLLVIARRSRRD